MVDKRIVGVLLAAFVLVAGLGWAAYQPQPQPPSEPVVTNFEVSDPVCYENFSQNISIAQYSAAETTNVTISQNVTVPNASTTLAVGGLISDGTNYTLSFVRRDSDAPPRDCATQVRYTVTVSLPQGKSNEFGLSVRYDGEPLVQIGRGEKGSGASSSASGDE
ncbi:MAG: hypothetical protein ABEH81_09925 [Halopenitus sp.]